jgi:hypothetical protein
MADFLGSILGSMAAPPRASDKEIAERKKAKELAKKVGEKNKHDSKVFRQKTEKRIDDFIKLPIGEDKNRRLVFEPLAKYHRSVVHDVSEIAGLAGRTRITKYILTCKLSTAPFSTFLWRRRRRSPRRCVAEGICPV